MDAGLLLLLLLLGGGGGGRWLVAEPCPGSQDSGTELGCDFWVVVGSAANREGAVAEEEWFSEEVE